MALTDDQEKALREELTGIKKTRDDLETKLATLDRKPPTPANDEKKTDLADHVARMNERIDKIEKAIGIGDKKEPSGYFFEE